MKRICRRFQTFSNEERGGVIILVALLMVTLLGMTALAVDVGLLYSARRQMVNAADAAALAGAQELINGGDAVAVATQYAILENHADNAQAYLGYYNGSPTYNTVTVNTEKTVDYLFARALSLGQNSSDVAATATALIASIVEMGGLKPIGLPLSVWEGAEEGQDGLTFVAHGTFGPGSWGFVSFPEDDFQAATVRARMYNGYPYPVSVGETINIIRGHDAAQDPHAGEPIDEHITNGTIFMVPIVEDWDEHPGGGHRETKVLGFAAVQLTDLDGQGNSYDLSGKFIKTIAVGTIDPSAPDFGLKGITLIE